MKIEARCETCDRVFVLSLIGPESDTPGRCPFCGARFGRHYTTVLPEAVRRAETAADEVITALGRLQAMETGFEIDIDQALALVARSVREHQPEPTAR